MHQFVYFRNYAALVPNIFRKYTRVINWSAIIFTAIARQNCCRITKIFTSVARRQAGGAPSSRRVVNGLTWIPSLEARYCSTPVLCTSLPRTRPSHTSYHRQARSSKDSQLFMLAMLRNFRDVSCSFLAWGYNGQVLCLEFMFLRCLYWRCLLYSVKWKKIVKVYSSKRQNVHWVHCRLSCQHYCISIFDTVFI